MRYNMIKKINIFLVLLLLLVSITAVSAVDDNGTEIISNDAVHNTVEVSDDDVIDADNDLNDAQNLKAASHVVSESNYNKYFDLNGTLISSSVNQGDTINLDGSFSSKSFVFDKKVNIVGTSSNSMKNSIITLLNGASGSTVLNLNIQNTKNEAYGIFLNSASNCVVSNCVIKNTGRASYAICVANGANYNNITNNDLKDYGITYGHGTRSTPALIVSGSHYNYIANNKVEVDDANGIYLSSYDGGPLKGGDSNFNVIYNNTVKCNDEILPTSWSYNIQIMGNNNTIKANKVLRGYRGISTSGSGNIIIDNTIINITGADYNNIGVENGGEFAIVGSYNSIVRNNKIIDSKIISTGSGISVIDNSIVENNWINVTKAGRGILAGGSNVVVKDNTVFTEQGSGIYEKDEGSGLLVENNQITSVSGVGILIEKLSSKRMPSNVTVIGNTVITGNKVAIDASGVQKDTSNIDIESNNVFGKVINTPAGVIDTSKPTYIFNGNTITITESNFDTYINGNGGLTSEIKDGDILNFQGTFNNKIIYVTKSVKITGNNPIFYNSTFKVTSGNVLIENLNIINKASDRVNAWGIFTNQAPGVRIQNNKITVSDPKAAYAIYVLESSDIDVFNNELTSEGDYLTFTLMSYASESCNFVNNTIKTIGTGEVYNFIPEKCIDGNEFVIDGTQYCIDGNEMYIDGNYYCLDGEEVAINGNVYCIDGNELSINGNVYCMDGAHIVSEIYQTYGILLLYSSNNVVSGNDVEVTSKLAEVHSTVGEDNSTNSLVGIDLYFNSHNNVFSNNDVFIKGNDNYIYGMGVLGYNTGHKAPEGQGATNNTFEANTINLEGPYFTTGIIVGAESEGTILKDNQINLASGVSYAITLELSQSSTIENNKADLNAEVIYGIEALSSDDNYITGNIFNLDSKQAYGMLISNGNNNIISENTMNVKASDESLTIKNLDSISGGNAGIYLKSSSTNNNIFNNNITSLKGYAVLIDDTALDNVINDNYLVSEKGNGNQAVSNSKGNNVSDNYNKIADATIYVNPVTYLGNAEFKITFGNELDGAVVEFYDVDNVFVGQAVVSNGVCAFSMPLDSTYIPSTYIFTAKLSKENYKAFSYQIKFTVNNAYPTIVMDDVSVAQGDTVILAAKVLDPSGNPIKGAEVQFKRARNILGTATTDGNGLAEVEYVLPPSLNVGEYELTAEVMGLKYYNDFKVAANLFVLQRVNVIISPNSNYYVKTGVVAVLKDSNGNVIGNKEVSLKFDSTTYSVNTTADGKIIIPAKVNAGSYQLTITSAAEGKYNENSTSLKVKVVKPIAGGKNYSVYYGNTIKYKVRIFNVNGKAVGAGKVVTFKVNGKSKNVKTDKNGYATYSAKLKAGTYTITAKYSGNEVSNKLTFKPTVIAKNIAKKKAKTIKFSAKLVNKNGKILKNKKITFKVASKKYTAKTNNKGVATISIKNLKVGKYTVTSSYSGCSVKNTIQIKK